MGVHAGLPGRVGGGGAVSAACMCDAGQLRHARAPRRRGATGGQGGSSVGQHTTQQRQRRGGTEQSVRRHGGRRRRPDSASCGRGRRHKVGLGTQPLSRWLCIDVRLSRPCARHSHARPPPCRCPRWCRVRWPPRRYVRTDRLIDHHRRRRRCSDRRRRMAQSSDCIPLVLRVHRSSRTPSSSPRAAATACTCVGRSGRAHGMSWHPRVSLL